MSSLQVSSAEAEAFSDVFESTDAMLKSHYLAMRTEILGLDKEAATTYLSSTECRKKVHGDIGLIIRVHNFLEKNGLINKGLAPQTLLPNVGQEGGTPGGVDTATKPVWKELAVSRLNELILEHKGDWKKVSAAMTQLGEGKSAAQCMAKYLTINSASKEVVSSGIIYELCAEMGDQEMNHCIRIAQEILSKQGHQNVHETLCGTLSLAVVSNAAQKDATQMEEVKIKTLVRQYIQLRMEAIEEKRVILDGVEESLQTEMTRHECARRDNQMMRAYNFFIENPPTL